MHSVDDQLLHTRRQRRRLIVINHRPASFIATFDEHASAGDVGHHVIGRPGDPGLLAAEVAFQTQRVIDDDFTAVLHSGDIEKLKGLAREKRMPLLFDDGLRRAFNGDTTLEEVFRVALAG